MNQAIAETLAATFSFWERLDSEAKKNILNQGQYINEIWENLRRFPR